MGLAEQGWNGGPLQLVPALDGQAHRVSIADAHLRGALTGDHSIGRQPRLLRRAEGAYQAELALATLADEVNDYEVLAAPPDDVASPVAGYVVGEVASCEADFRAVV